MLVFEWRAAMRAVRRAAEKILKIYENPFEVEYKEDASPVTAADKAADAAIREYLHEIFPNDAFLTEESVDDGSRFHAERCWIVDPVDGTKEFIARNGEFTTNIALCINHEIVLGLIHVPLQNKTYFAIKGEGAFLHGEDGDKRLHVSDRVNNRLAMRSISHFRAEEQAFMEANKERFAGDPVAVGAALKFGRLASGEFDFFFRFSNGTKEWDVAPGDLIVKEAGGFMCQPNGEDFTYNREDVYNRNGYVMGNIREPWMFER